MSTLTLKKRAPVTTKTLGRRKSKDELAVTLRPVFDPKKHSSDAVKLLTYFNRLWQYSLPKKDALVYIPLTRLYKTLTSGKNRFLAPLIANIWFQRQTRGSSIDHKVSSWTRRDHPLMNQHLLRILTETKAFNVEVTESVWKCAAEKNTVEISETVKTKIIFPSDLHAQAFAEAAVELMKLAEEEL